MIHEDAEGDGRSVMWDGEKAWLGPDELDAPGLLDGRAGMRSAVFYDAEVGVQLTLAGRIICSRLWILSYRTAPKRLSQKAPTRFLSVCRQREGGGG